MDDLNARVARNLLLPRVGSYGAGRGVGIGRESAADRTILVSAMRWDKRLRLTIPAYGAGLQVSLPIAQQGGTSAACRRSGEQDARRLYGAAGPAADHAGCAAGDQSLELANASIEAAVLARDLAQKNVDAEQQKYELGSITAFEVLDSQTRLSSAQSALLNANVGYQEAYINYQRATAVLLDGLGMVIETPKVK